MRLIAIFTCLMIAGIAWMIAVPMEPCFGCSCIPHAERLALELTELKDVTNAEDPAVIDDVAGVISDGWRENCGVDAVLLRGGLVSFHCQDQMVYLQTEQPQ